MLPDRPDIAECGSLGPADCPADIPADWGSIIPADVPADIPVDEEPVVY